VAGVLSINHTYSSTGTYSVNLTATSSLGCQKSSSQNLTVNPKPTTNGFLPH
jgi:PKD repeat protein